MKEVIEALVRRRPEAALDVALGPDHLAAFAERGFTSIERITTDEELAWLREVYDWLFADRVQAVRGGYFDLARPYESEGEDELPQILVPETLVPDLRRTAFWRNGRRLAAQLLEADGCLRFIPGSHRGPVRVHHHVGDDPTVHALVTDDADPAQAVSVPLPAGGAIFHHCRTLHSSGPNTSDHVRRAYANEWQVPPVRRDAPERRPWVDAGKRAWESRQLR